MITIRFRTRWLRIATVVAVVALVAVPTVATAGHRFTDVPTGDTFHNDISAIDLAGVTKGCNPPTNDRYCPEDFVTRGQMAAFLNRLGALSGQTPVVNADKLDGLDADDFVKVGEGGGPADADTLDGLDSTDFWQKTEAVDAATLDGSDSTDFVAKGEADSVTSAMTTSEAGVAQSVRTNALVLTTSIQSVVSVTVNAPSSGYVIVSASAQAKAIHTNGTQTHLQVDVSSSSTAYPDTSNTKNYVVPQEAPTTIEGYTTIVSVQRAFPVSAGSNTFHFIAHEVSNTGDTEIDDVTLTAVFVPTAYGTVSQ